jgi:hypothetical protein
VTAAPPAKSGDLAGGFLKMQTVQHKIWNERFFRNWTLIVLKGYDQCINDLDLVFTGIRTKRANKTKKMKLTDTGFFGISKDFECRFFVWIFGQIDKLSINFWNKCIVQTHGEQENKSFISIIQYLLEIRILTNSYR